MRFLFVKLDDGISISRGQKDIVSSSLYQLP